MEQLNFGISKHLDSLSEAQIDLYKNFQREVIKTFFMFKGEAETSEMKQFVDEQLNEMFHFEMDLVNASAFRSV